MSEQAERFVIARAAALAMPDPCKRRAVLMALADAHVAGPLVVASDAVAKAAGLQRLDFWSVMMAVHRTGIVQAANIGGRMTVVFGFDFPEDHSDYKPAPAAREGGA